MVACLNSSNEEKLKIFPPIPNWLLIIFGFGICAIVACKSQAASKIVHEQTMDQKIKIAFKLNTPILIAQIEKKKRKKRVRKKSVVGRKAADKYFQPEEGAEKKEPRRMGADDHFLAIHVGTYLNGTSFAWGATRKVEDAGNFTGGVTYRMGEWTKSMDLLIRFDVNSFELPEGKPVKYSLMPIIQFPEASSRFPLYFGIGAGVGVFSKQISDESDVSLDYQLIAGVRFFNVFETVGFFAESGIKNHLHILSSGQFGGTFISAGSVFAF